ncbi:MAG: hypothetical protein AAGI22_28920 [Planctomycetota bacterium]
MTLSPQISLPALVGAALLASPGAPSHAKEGPPPRQAAAGHLGAPVAAAETGSEGPARYVGPLFDAFDTGIALEDAVFIDGFYRTPASPLYDAVIDRLAARLRQAGFGSADGLTLRIVSTERESPAWWPLSALLEARSEAGSETLLAFASPGDEHRTMLPVGAPDADVDGPVAFSVDGLVEGGVLVTKAPLSGQMLRRAKSRGAGAVLSASLFPFTVDPLGDRHLDAIKFSKMPRGNDVPVAKISPRALARIEALYDADPATHLRFRARTGTAVRPLRTLIAEIVGWDRGEEAVAIASHLQEPGAGDNAAGAAGLASSACAIARCLREGSIERPSRTVAFVFGDEMIQSSIWLEHSKRTTVAALSADMLGQSPERTGAIALLERTPDPGALYTIPPDEHTPWGAGRVSEDDLVPNGVNLICRQALVDVGTQRAPGWRTSENPWEGGSDHDVFNARRIPAALMWHFTDFTYHTSLDRMSMIDTGELRRTCAAISSAALALADTRRTDLPRHLASNEMERELRVGAAEELGNVAAVDAWNVWCDGVADWLDAFAVD